MFNVQCSTIPLGIYAR